MARSSSLNLDDVNQCDPTDEEKFAQEGVPEVIVSDNGPQLVSEEIEK